MEKLTDRKQIKTLYVLSVFIYFISYTTRINFATVISEFIAAEGVKMSAASLIVTAATVTYGVGQLISGFLGDRMSPINLIFFGLILTTAMNFSMPFCAPDIKTMAICWGINGFAQACMWPPLVKILSGALTFEQYLDLIPFFGISTGGGTMFVYLTAPLLINISGWRLVFYVTTGFGCVAAIIWLTVTRKLLKGMNFTENIKNTGKTQNVQKVKFPYGIILVVLLSIAMQGALRDGITTWIPSFFIKTFNLTSSASILTSVIIPLFHVIFNFFVYKILYKMKNRVFTCVTMLFSVLTLFLLALLLFGTKALLFAIPCLAGVSGAVNGINSLQTTCIQNYFNNGGNMSFLSGLFNSAVYAGSSVATYVFAVVAESRGWNSVLLLWVGIALVGAILTAISGKGIDKKGYSFS